ncbi:hypothetical protein EIP86_010229 [Pleurotus ostreatoroseus]|nr:hypothetical protein EIP86_010229 [Pleurotus ostreatoroseus]
MTLNQTLTVADMPLPKTRGAPTKFKGKSTEVDIFLHHYERLCRKYNVDLDEEKLENITQYCSKEVREFMEGLPSYVNGDFEQFVKDVRKYFEADKDTKRYRVSDLERYVREKRHAGSMKTMAAWMAYNRGFIRRGGWLMKEDKISEREYATYFWQGIPSKFRARLESRLMSQYPTHDISEPFSTQKINKAAEAMLRRDRFDNDRLTMDKDEWNERDDDEEEGDNDEDSSESEGESNASESDDEIVRYISKKSKNTTKRAKGSRKVVMESDDEDFGNYKRTRSDSRHEQRAHHATPAKKSTRGEDVQDLIEQLNRMSLDDPTYATVYLRACRKDPLVKECVPSPNERRRQAMAIGPRYDRPPMRSGPPFDRQPPPHMNGPPGLAPPSGYRCLGCGRDGHGPGSCPELQKLIEQGIIKRDSNRRAVMSNGQYIAKANANETLAEAARRIHASSATQSHYVAMAYEEGEEEAEEEVYFLAEEQDDLGFSVDWDEDQDRYWDEEDSAPYTYPVVQKEKSTTAARKERMDGVWPPARKQQQAEQQRRYGPPSKPKGKENSAPRRNERVPLNPKPIDPQPVYMPKDQDIEMEDHTPAIGVPMKPKEVSAQETHKSASAESDKRQPRRSELQSYVNPRATLGKILNASITMPVGELLAVSKEMSQGMQDIMKPKTAKPIDSKPATVHTHAAKIQAPDGSPMVAASFMTQTKGTLIKLQMECSGNPICAIIDTGSQLNIAHRRVWKSCFKIPMDRTKSIIMSDANGGEGKLEGFIPNLPLNCGQVLTHASLWVGDQAPFDLLLGRPWQRGNFVSIDERIDGTYLLFKDKSMEVKYEILVTPEETVAYDREIAEYVARTQGLLNRLEVHMTTVISSHDAQILESEYAACMTQGQEMLRESWKMKNAPIGPAARIRDATEEDDDSNLSSDTSLNDDEEDPPELPMNWIEGPIDSLPNNHSDQAYVHAILDMMAQLPRPALRLLCTWVLAEISEIERGPYAMPNFDLPVVMTVKRRSMSEPPMSTAPTSESQEKAPPRKRMKIAAKQTCSNQEQAHVSRPLIEENLGYVTQYLRTVSMLQDHESATSASDALATRTVITSDDSDSDMADDEDSEDFSDLPDLQEMSDDSDNESENAPSDSDSSSESESEEDNDKGRISQSSKLQQVSARVFYYPSLDGILDKPTDPWYDPEEEVVEERLEYYRWKCYRDDPREYRRINRLWYEDRVKEKILRRAQWMAQQALVEWHRRKMRIFLKAVTESMHAKTYEYSPRPVPKPRLLLPDAPPTLKALRPVKEKDTPDCTMVGMAAITEENDWENEEAQQAIASIQDDPDPIQALANLLGQVVLTAEEVVTKGIKVATRLVKTYPSCRDEAKQYQSDKDDPPPPPPLVGYAGFRENTSNKSVGKGCKTLRPFPQRLHSADVTCPNCAPEDHKSTSDLMPKAFEGLTAIWTGVQTQEDTTETPTVHAEIPHHSPKTLSPALVPMSIVYADEDSWSSAASDGSSSEGEEDAADPRVISPPASSEARASLTDGPTTRTDPRTDDSARGLESRPADPRIDGITTDEEEYALVYQTSQNGTNTHLNGTPECADSICEMQEGANHLLAISDPGRIPGALGSTVVSLDEEMRTWDLRIFKQNAAPDPAKKYLECFGCGNFGHGLRQCMTMAYLCLQGILVINPDGKYAHADGRPIRRRRRIPMCVIALEKSAEVSDDEKLGERTIENLEDAASAHTDRKKTTPPPGSVAEAEDRPEGGWDDDPELLGWMCAYQGTDSCTQAYQSGDEEKKEDVPRIWHRAASSHEIYDQRTGWRLEVIEDDADAPPLDDEEPLDVREVGREPEAREAPATNADIDPCARPDPSEQSEDNKEKEVRTCETSEDPSTPAMDPLPNSTTLYEPTFVEMPLGIAHSHPEPAPCVDDERGVFFYAETLGTHNAPDIHRRYSTAVNCTGSVRKLNLSGHAFRMVDKPATIVGDPRMVWFFALVDARIVLEDSRTGTATTTVVDGVLNVWVPPDDAHRPQHAHPCIAIAPGPNYSPPSKSPNDVSTPHDAETIVPRTKDSVQPTPAPAQPQPPQPAPLPTAPAPASPPRPRVLLSLEDIEEAMSVTPDPARVCEELIEQAKLTRACSILYRIAEVSFTSAENYLWDPETEEIIYSPMYDPDEVPSSRTLDERHMVACHNSRVVAAAAVRGKGKGVDRPQVVENVGEGVPEVSNTRKYVRSESGSEPAPKRVRSSSAESGWTEFARQVQRYESRSPDKMRRFLIFHLARSANPQISSPVSAPTDPHVSASASTDPRVVHVPWSSVPAFSGPTTTPTPYPFFADDSAPVLVAYAAQRSPAPLAPTPPGLARTLSEDEYRATHGPQGLLPPTPSPLGSPAHATADPPPPPVLADARDILHSMSRAVSGSHSAKEAASSGYAASGSNTSSEVVWSWGDTATGTRSAASSSESSVPLAALPYDAELLYADLPDAAIELDITRSTSNSPAPVTASEAIAFYMCGGPAREVEPLAAATIRRHMLSQAITIVENAIEHGLLEHLNHKSRERPPPREDGYAVDRYFRMFYPDTERASNPYLHPQERLVVYQSLRLFETIRSGEPDEPYDRWIKHARYLLAFRGGDFEQTERIRFHRRLGHLDVGMPRAHVLEAFRL